MEKQKLYEMAFNHISNIFDVLRQLNDEGKADEKTHEEALKRFNELINYKI